MNILILGSSGFIGSNLFYGLSSKYNVWGADLNFRNAYTHFILDKDNPDFSIIFKDRKFDYCINCTGSANVQESMLNPYYDFNSNFSNLARLLDVILKFNPECKVLNFSSAAVYGNPVSLPITVNDRVLPLSAYGLHKLLSERFLSEYSRIFGLLTCSVRVFSAYGNGQKKLFPWDCYQKINNPSNSKFVFFFGTGNESRDYIHIRDIINQIDLVINNGQFNGEVYNVANGQEIYIKDIANLIKIYSRSSTIIKFTGNSRIGDPLNWKADITQMLKWGYRVSVSIEDGIKEYVKWAKENV